MKAAWKKTPLGKVIDIHDSRRIPLSGAQRGQRQGKYPYYGAQSIIDYIDDYIFDGKFILIAEDGENLRSRKEPIAFFASGKFWVNNHAHIVTARPELADDYFIKACLNHANLAAYVTGAAQPKLSQGNLKLIELNLPDLPTQRKIAGILSAYDDLIENNLRRIKILEQMAQSLYREWFVHFRFPRDPSEASAKAGGHESATFKDSELGRIPEGWEVKKLGELADQMRRGVSKGQLDEVTELGSNKLLFKRGEVLFGKIRPYFHKVVVAPFDGVCSADTIIIRAKKPEHRALVTSYVFTEAFVAHATATSNGSKMPRTDWKVLKDYPLVVPPEDLLARFSTLSENAIDQQQNLVRRNQTLRRTRDLLLPKLLSDGGNDAK